MNRAAIWKVGGAIALASAAGNLPAKTSQTWQLVGKSDDSLVMFYVDPKSAVVRGPLRMAKLLYDYQQVQQDPDTMIETRSIVGLASFDCRGHRLGTVQSTSYANNMGRGKVVEKSDVQAPKAIRYVKATPNSIDAKVLGFVCSLP